ncbi:PLD nuclease N-terminal domain-containing protein [Pseudomonas sp. NY15437]|uniref:PLD nuclease N-terminal domain-containing protein n=1 Tax=unclassified Pseudomonas TaxID=196821 RepID=UPI00223A6AFA|nr:PLD nuclease N-terminal domain-containing protein [Pseudomonas sp. GCEP-101]
MSTFALASWFWIAVAIIIVLLDLWAIVSIFRSDKDVNAKALWSLLIVIFPVVGLAIWGVAGPRGVAQEPPVD